MSTASFATALTCLRTEAASHAAEERSDVQLLHAYATTNDQAAFAALVRRHGSIVFGVCRRVLQDSHDAEDAFQAVFLVLARKAATLRNGEALSCWLHGVSYRIAMSAKRDSARRRQYESRVAPRVNPPAWEVGWRELQAILDEEVAQLAPAYHSVFLLCCLEGLSKAEAAQRLGIKENTVSSRLARARKQLQERLLRRGISLTAVLAALAVSGAGRATPPLRLVRTATAAAWHGAGTPVTGLSARAISLAEGVTPTMLSIKTQLALLVLVLCSLGTALGLFFRPAGASTAAPPSRPPVPAESRDGKRKAVVYVHPEKLTAKDTLLDGPAGKPIAIKAETTFVWMEPGAAGGSEYVLIATGGTRIVKGRRWPVLNGRDLRDARKERETLESLRGTWVIESGVWDGKKEQPTKKNTLIIAERRLWTGEGDGRESFAIKLDVTCTPGAIDLTPLARDGSPSGKDPIEGIYEIRQGRLRLCFSVAEGVRQRPVAFESKKGSQTFLWDLQRSQPEGSK